MCIGAVFSGDYRCAYCSYVGLSCVVLEGFEKCLWCSIDRAADEYHCAVSGETEFRVVRAILATRAVSNHLDVAVRVARIFEPPQLGIRGVAYLGEVMGDKIAAAVEEFRDLYGPDFNSGCEHEELLKRFYLAMLSSFDDEVLRAVIDDSNGTTDVDASISFQFLYFTLEEK